jgi:hypothetical protein
MISVMIMVSECWLCPVQDGQVPVVAVRTCMAFAGIGCCSLPQTKFNLAIHGDMTIRDVRVIEFLFHKPGAVARLSTGHVNRRREVSVLSHAGNKLRMVQVASPACPALPAAAIIE